MRESARFLRGERITYQIKTIIEVKVDYHATRSRVQQPAICCLGRSVTLAGPLSCVWQCCERVFFFLCNNNARIMQHNTAAEFLFFF